MADNWSKKQEDGHAGHRRSGSSLRSQSSGRPWASPSHGLDSATGEEMVAVMNSVGVDGAILVSSFSAYEYDPSYALEVYNTYPDSFGLSPRSTRPIRRLTMSWRNGRRRQARAAFA
jgi:hypothetical protein